MTEIVVLLSECFDICDKAFHATLFGRRLRRSSKFVALCESAKAAYAQPYVSRPVSIRCRSMGQTGRRQLSVISGSCWMPR